MIERQADALRACFVETLQPKDVLVIECRIAARNGEAGSEVETETAAGDDIVPQVERDLVCVIGTRINIPAVVGPVRIVADFDRPQKSLFGHQARGVMEIGRRDAQAETVEDRRAFNVMVNVVHAVVHEIAREDIAGERPVHAPGNIVMGISGIDRHAAGLFGHVQIIPVKDIGRQRTVLQRGAVDRDRTIEIEARGVAVEVLAEEPGAVYVERKFERQDRAGQAERKE